MSNLIKHLIQIVESNQYEIPESDIDITAEHIVKVPGGYELKSKKTGRNLGKYPTRAGAEKRERQVQYFKHANEDTAISMIDDDISDLQNFVRAAYKAELGFNPDWSQEEWHDREFLMHWLERLTTYQSDDDDDTDVSVSELHETASDLTPDELRSWGDRPVTFKSGGFEYKVRSYTNHGDRLYLNIDSDDGRKIEREYSYSQLQGEVKQSSKGQRLSISLKPLSEAEETHQEKRDRIKKLTPAITRKQSGDKDWKLKPEEVRSRIHDTDYQNRTAHDINQGSAEASLNELSKDTLDSYRKKRSADNRLDRQFADRARDIAANKRTDGDDQKAAKWEDEADWLDNRVKKGEKGVALAATKLGVTEGYDEFDDEEESNLHSGSYVRDREDPSGEVFVMRGDASERRVQILDRNGSGWNISPSRLIAVDANDPAIARYFGKQGVTEGSDYTPPKLGTVKANLMNTQKPTVQVKVFKHNTLRGDSYWVTKEVKTFKTMDQAQAHVDRINKQGVTEGAMDELHADLSDKYNELAPGIEKYKDEKGADNLYRELLAIARHHGAEREFSRMCNGARNRAHMDYDTNPGHFKNWFWYLGLGNEQGVAEGSSGKNKLKQEIKQEIKELEKQARHLSFEPSQTDPKTGNGYRPNYIKTVEKIEKLQARLKSLKGVAEGGEKDRQWSRQDMERLRVATRDFDDIMASDGPEAFKQELIKKRIKTKPMAGPKGVLPEQGVAEAVNPALANLTPDEIKGIGMMIQNGYDIPTIIRIFDNKPTAEQITAIATANMQQGVAEGWDKLTPQQKAHEYNLDAAQREMDRRHAEGEDMTGAKIDKKTYQIIKPKQRGVAEEASPMIKPANNRFDNKQEAFKYAKEHGGSVFRSQYIDPNTGVKNISFVVKKKDS